MKNDVQMPTEEDIKGYCKKNKLWIKRNIKNLKSYKITTGTLFKHCRMTRERTMKTVHFSVRVPLGIIFEVVHEKTDFDVFLKKNSQKLKMTKINC